MCVHTRCAWGQQCYTRSCSAVAKQRELLVTGSSSQQQSEASQDGSDWLYLVSKKLLCVLGCLIVVPNPYDYRPCVKISRFPSLVVVGEGGFILECSAVRV